MFITYKWFQSFRVRVAFIQLIAQHQGTDPYCFVEFDNHETALDALTKMNGKKLFSKVRSSRTRTPFFRLVII